MIMLPVLAHRKTIAITQQSALKENISKDYKYSFYHHNRGLLFLYRIFSKSRVLRVLMDCARSSFINYYCSKILSLPHYQTVLDDEYRDICKTLKDLGIKISLDGVNDIAGWSFVNADYASWFGTNKRVSITSGTCYFAHVFCRCLQPFIIERQNGERMWALLRLRMNRQFRRTMVGLLTNNHMNAISFLNLIPDDDSLLFGIEQFIILHEMGHAYSDTVENGPWPYTLKPSANIVKRIDRDEEVKADIFAVHTLYYVYQKDKQQELLLFAPVFFFKIYSWLEEEGLIVKPCGHPISYERCTYLMEEIQYLIPMPTFYTYRDLLDEVWDKNKDKICRQVENYRKKFSIYEDILEDVMEDMRDFLDTISNSAESTSISVNLQEELKLC